MPVIKRGASVGAAALAVGLYLAGPQPIAVADDSGSDNSSVSSNARKSATDRSEPTAARTGRSTRSAPAASARRALGEQAGVLPQQVHPAAAVTRHSARPTQPTPRPAEAADAQPVSEPTGKAAVPAAVVRSERPQVPGPTATRWHSDPMLIAAPAVPPATPAAETPAGVPVQAQTPIARATVASPSNPLAAVDGAVQNWFSSVTDWLAEIPANPVADLFEGALLLIRRSLFNQAPTAQVQQDFVGAPPDFQVVAAIDATDPEGDPLTYTLTADPTIGTVTLAADGSFSYTPNDPARFETDEFTVKVSDSGFNLLDPFSDRSTMVSVTVAPTGVVGYSQGFDIINLTDKVLWLTKAGVNDKTAGYPQDWVNDSCNDHGFCLNSMVGRALQPGEAIPFQATTDPNIFVYMMFSSNDGSNWGVRVLPRYKNSETIIDSFYAEASIGPYIDGGYYLSADWPEADDWKIPDRPEWAWPVGATPGVVRSLTDRTDLGWRATRTKTIVDWTYVRTGSWSTTPLQPVAYSTQNGNRLFLTQGIGQTYTIAADATWSGAPPSWCGYCQPVDTVKNGIGPALDPQTVLNNFLKANPAAPDGTNYPQYQNDFTPQYQNLKFLNFVTDLAGADETGSRIEVLNEAGNEGVTVSRSGSVELNPGPGTEQDPNAPWWKGPASQAAQGAATFLLGKFVGDSIASTVGSAIGGFLAPGQVAKKITATTTTAQVTPSPHSFSVLTTVGGVSRYVVTGDVTYSIPTSDGGQTKFIFKQMDFVINDPTAKGTKDGQTLNAHFETVPYQKAGGTNVGFRLSDKASWNQGLGVPSTNPTYRVDPATEHLLGLEMFLGSAANARGEDASGKVCGGDKTTNCAILTIDNANVAEIKVLNSNQAVLVAKAPGTATVTATYNWSIDVGGAIQSLTGSVKATMGVTVTS